MSRYRVELRVVVEVEADSEDEARSRVEDPDDLDGEVLATEILAIEESHSTD